MVEKHVKRRLDDKAMALYEKSESGEIERMLQNLPPAKLGEYLHEYIRQHDINDGVLLMDMLVRMWIDEVNTANE